MDQKKSPIDIPKKSLLFMDQNSTKTFFNKKNFTRLQISFLIKKRTTLLPPQKFDLSKLFKKLDA